MPCQLARSWISFCISTFFLYETEHWWLNILILFYGMMVVITGIGGGIYVAAGIGAGPRDGFMLSVWKKPDYRSVGQESLSRASS